MKSLPNLNPWLDRLHRARVLVLGDIMQDVFIFGRVRRISPEAPVPVVEVTRETSMLGGAANVVNNVLALGARAALAGVIGRDQPGAAVKDELDRIKVDRTCVIEGRSRPTAVKTRVIAHHQQVVRFDREEKRPLKPETVAALWQSLTRIVARVDAVIVSDYAKGLVTEDLMRRLLELCRAKRKPVIVDPKPAHIDWYRGAFALTPNEKEAAEAAGFEIENQNDLERAGAELLRRLECQALLITRGERGMSLFRPGCKSLHIPTRAREVYDVTGAGDAVIGVFTVALIAGMDVVSAMQTANIAGGIVVGKLGTSVASVDEIKAAINGKKRKR
jgi:D-glycero-beta-D-manno-heptose-7-phosphate kinase